ncbi:MAG TPA: DUF6519 domain-containing protein, partial [Pseudoxanthomonas sp.]
KRLRVASTRGFLDAQWVELSDEDDDLQGRPGTLCRLASIDGDELVLTTDAPRQASATSKVRRWDQQAREDVSLDDGAVPLRPSGLEDDWIDLEGGLQVRFDLDREYLSGDYWHVAVRTTGDTSWPHDRNGHAVAQPPHGTAYHYAPLGFVGLSAIGTPDILAPCTCLVYPSSTCVVPQAQLVDNVFRATENVVSPGALTTPTIGKAAPTKTLRKRKER